MMDFGIGLASVDLSDRQRRQWHRGYLVYEPGVVTVAPHPLFCGTGNTLFILFGRDGRELPTMLSSGPPAVVHPAGSMWLCVDVIPADVARTVNPAAPITFIVLQQVPCRDGVIQGVLPTAIEFTELTRSAMSQVQRTDWTMLGTQGNVAAVVPSIENRCGAVNLRDLGETSLAPAVSSIMTVGSVEAIADRFLGAVRPLVDGSCPAEDTDQLYPDMRLLAAHFGASNVALQALPAHVVALRESILVGHLHGDSWCHIEPVALWQRALEAFAEYSETTADEVAAFPTTLRVLWGSRHGSAGQPEHPALAAERAWINGAVRRALALQHQDWLHQAVGGR